MIEEILSCRWNLAWDSKRSIVWQEEIPCEAGQIVMQPSQFQVSETQRCNVVEGRTYEIPLTTTQSI